MSHLVGTMIPLACLFVFAIVQSLLQRFVDLSLANLALTQRNGIRTPVRDWKPQCPCHSIFLSFLHLPQFFLPLLAFFRFFLLCGLVRIVGFGVPVQIFSFLPAANWCHKRMSEVVLALGIIFDIFPFKIHAAARAFLSHCLEEIHGERRSPFTSYKYRR